MAKFHLNPNGSIGRCNAVGGNCPYGGVNGEENHYGSLPEAKQDYENKMRERNIPKLDKTFIKTNDSQELVGLHTKNKILENSRSEDFIRGNGGDDYYSISALTRNPNAPGDVLVKAYSKTSDGKLKRQLMEHRNYPVEAMTLEEFQKTLTNDNKMYRFRSDAITDDHALRMMNNDSDVNGDRYSPTHKAALRMLRNPNNKVTGSFIKNFLNSRKVSKMEYELYIKPNVGVKI